MRSWTYFHIIFLGSRFRGTWLWLIKNQRMTTFKLVKPILDGCHWRWRVWEIYLPKTRIESPTIQLSTSEQLLLLIMWQLWFPTWQYLTLKYRKREIIIIPINWIQNLSLNLCNIWLKFEGISPLKYCIMIRIMIKLV